MSFQLFIALFFCNCAFAATTWEYDEANNNVSHWPDLYAECGWDHQSPIDIPLNNQECTESLLLDWESEETVHFAVRNNGHSIQAVPFEITHNGGSDISGLEVLHHANDTTIRLTNGFYNTYRSAINREYCFDSLHFHWGQTDEFGSEHALNGKYYPLEVHLVHYSCDYHTINDALTAYSGGATEQYDDENVLAVIGVLFEIGEANPVIDRMLSDAIMPAVEKYENPADEQEGVLSLYYTEFNLADLLPSSKQYFGYEGSLTTPPCYETVRWHVMQQTMTISQEQLDKFQSVLASEESDDIMAPNYRPVQEINGREIYECEEDVIVHEVEKEVVIDELSTEGSGDGGDEEVDLWFIIGVVFICLFGVAVIIIGSLLYYMNGLKNCQQGYDHTPVTPKEQEEEKQGDKEEKAYLNH